MDLPSRIETAAKEFRWALENCDRRGMPETLQRFPWGSCGDASELLARYLFEQGFGWLEYVSGVNEEPHSHA